MWWNIVGNLDGKLIRYRVEAINEAVASTLARWKGIEILTVAPEELEPGLLPQGQRTLLDSFGPFVGDVPPSLGE